jgi:hypothetical protein
MVMAGAEHGSVYQVLESVDNYGRGRPLPAHLELADGARGEGIAALVG